MLEFLRKRKAQAVIGIRAGSINGKNKNECF